MLQLRTIFPYGFNYRLVDDFIKKGTNVLVGSKFPTLPRKSTRISQDHVRKLSTSLSPDKFSYKFKFYLQNKISDSPKFSRIHLIAMHKQKKLKQTAILLNESLNDTSNSLYTQ